MAENTNVQQEQISQAYLALVWWKFKKNKMAVVGGIIVILFYLLCGVLAEFVSPYPLDFQSDYLEARPQPLVFKNQEGKFSLIPAVYGLEETVDVELRKRMYTVDKTQNFPLALLPKAAES
ncbi:MAG: hypothetical protein K8R89_00960, partial [Anaerolineae bacterium]|nr:hypothetical protein [Anaerolineae bacterium]